MREFCTAGPIVAEQHYFVPPLERLDLPHVMELIDGHKYFLLHAPRQTGKTTCLRALVEELNRGGKYRAVYCNIEGAQAIRENVTEGIRSVLSALSLAAQRWLNDPYVRERFDEALRTSGAGGALTSILTDWSLSDNRPLCIMWDETDALVSRPR